MSHLPQSRSRSLLLIVAALLLLLLTVPALAADDGDVGAGFPDQLALTLETPPHAISAGDDGLSVITIDGYQTQAAPGEPQLPGKLIDVALPPDADPATLVVTIVQATVTDLPGTYQIAPAPPAGTWDQDRPIVEWGPGAPAIVDGRNTAIYDADAFFPAQQLSLLTTGHLRKWQLARLVYSPVQFNPVSGQVRVTTSLSLTITFDRLPAEATADAVPASDTLLDALAAEQFVNYAEAQAWYRDETAAVSTLPGYVVITTNQIALNSAKLNTFLAHKAGQGYQTWLITEDHYGGLSGQNPNGRAEKVRQWLKNNYVANNVKYVLLIGNPDPDEPFVSDSVGDMPMKMMYPRYEQVDYRESPSDYFFADLTGNWDKDGDRYFGEYVGGDNVAGGIDFVAEVYVGRIPVYTFQSNWIGTLDSILQKTIDYELAGSPAWRRKALLPMAFSDASTDGAYLSEQMKSAYLNSRGFTSYTLYEQGSDTPEYNSTFSSNQELIWPAVRNHWKNTPYGLVVWWTHGWWGGASKVFNNDEATYLDNSRPALTFQVSCNNGEPEQGDNLGYALLRQGAIGTVSASRVSWYAVGQWSAHYDCGDNATLSYRFADLVTSDWAAGDALYQTKSDMGACWGGTSWMNFDDFNLYGDPAIKLTSTARPDLVPFAPAGYTYPVTPSAVKNGTMMSDALYAGRSTYFDWYAKNAGATTASGNFHVELWVDNTRLVNYPFSNWSAGSVNGFDDWSEGVATAGWHTVKLVVDPNNTIAESNENNNVWQQEFYWEPVDGCWTEYFNNETLAGDPVRVADEPGIDQEWGNGGPAGQNDHFSARWTCSANFAGGDYRFYWHRDDGLRAFIDGTRILNEWSYGHYEGTFDRAVSAGTHEVRVEAYEIDGWAETRFRWESLSGWNGTNIGDVVSGGSTVDGSTISLSATDGDFWSTADGLRYVYKSGSGDQTFIAQLTNWNAGGVGSAKTGLMVRASTDPGAPQYTIHVTGPSRAIKVKVRTASGASTTNINGPGSSALPMWFKLVKSGNTVTGYYSANGSSWTAVGGAQTLNGIGSTFLYGMAVASNSQSVQASATYALSGGTTPTITGFSPTTGGPGTLVTINGTNLGAATGVTFNGTAASFAIVSATQLQANVPNGATTGPISVVTPSGAATSAANFVVPGQGLNEVYVGAAKSGTVAGIPFTGADILHYTRASNTWAMLFDASDVGLNGNVSAFTFLPNGTILMSLVANATLPGVGAVTPMDVIQFVPTQLGNNTVGSFQWYFDGSDVGLAASTEKIDALSYFQTAAGSQRLRISTTGTATVTDDEGGSLTAHDEDILLFVISSPGATTVGHWSTNLHLDGTLIPGLAAEDVNGYGHDGVTEGKYLLISGTFNVAGAAGNGKSVVRLTPDDTAPGGYQATIVPWLASGATFPANLDGLEIVR